MKARRFFYVAGPRGRLLHIQFGKTHTEGLTACGKAVSAGWSWWQKRAAKWPVCARCENHA
jgi:hypothetical protein